MHGEFLIRLASFISPLFNALGSVPARRFSTNFSDCFSYKFRFYADSRANAKRIRNSPKENFGKPFIKWAGGKTQLAERILELFPADFFEKGRTYVEPFVGGGAMLFRVLRAFPNLDRIIVNDINPQLANAYACVRDNPEKLVRELGKLERAFFSAADFVDARQKFFLARREEFNRSRGNGVRAAALLIFLNRTCFNGLYRVNSRGEFNVPFGRYVRPKICDEETIFADSALLQNCEILCGDYAETFSKICGNALFYLDPPYKPLSKTSNFNAYAKENFDDAEQIRLRDFCKKLNAAGARWILSNSDARDENSGESFFEKLYAGFRIRRVPATRMINADPAKRGKLSELLISNFPEKQ